MIQGDLFEDRFLIEVDLFTGSQIQQLIEHKRTSFVGFFISESEKKNLLADAKIEGLSLSSYIRKSLGLSE